MGFENRTLGWHHRGRASCSATADGIPDASTFEEWNKDKDGDAPGNSGDAVPVAGDGQHYWLHRMLITADYAATLTLKGLGGKVILGPLYLPAGCGVFSWSEQELDVGLNSQPTVGLVPTAAGTLTATVDCWWDKGPK